MTTLQAGLGAGLRLALVLVFSGCASTRVAVPVMTAEGRAKSIALMTTQADARLISYSYSGPYGTVNFNGGELIHSEPTRAGAEVIRASGTAAGSVITSYYGGKSLLEGVRGNTQKNLDQGKTARHSASEKTARKVSDNATKVQMAEVQAQ